eukprot:1144419-Pelagomonas_calceolata.AAC.3
MPAKKAACIQVPSRFCAFCGPTDLRNGPEQSGLISTEVQWSEISFCVTTTPGHAQAPLTVGDGTGVKPIYEVQMQNKGLPFLAPSGDILLQHITAKECCGRPPVTFQRVEKVRRVCVFVKHQNFPSGSPFTKDGWEFKKYKGPTLWLRELLRAAEFARFTFSFVPPCTCAKHACSLSTAKLAKSYSLQFHHCMRMSSAMVHCSPVNAWASVTASAKVTRATCARGPEQLQPQRFPSHKPDWGGEEWEKHHGHDPASAPAEAALHKALLPSLALCHRGGQKIGRQAEHLGVMRVMQKGIVSSKIAASYTTADFCKPISASGLSPADIQGPT